jgi:hypothetical protein
MCTVCGCSDTKGHEFPFPFTHSHDSHGHDTITMTTTITTHHMAATCISAPAPPVSMWPA